MPAVAECIEYSMASLPDSALILVVCLLIFLIMSLVTNGVFFSISLYKNILSKPKGLPKKQTAAKPHESVYVQMSGVQESETISPYYTEIGPALRGELAPAKQSPYANLADVPN